jgi:PiT family inorganic phosphate transporter
MPMALICGLLILLVIGALFLAYSNGANDNFKGVATLFGSGTTSYKTALKWATVTTFLGSVAAIFLADVLVKNFSGKGLVPDELILAPEFAVSIAGGAALTVFLATRIGMPISTTHSLVGGLFGAGVVAVGSAFNFDKLFSAFAFPLLVSPLMAAVVSLLVYLIFKWLRIKMNVKKDTQLEIAKPGADQQAFRMNANSASPAALAVTYTGSLFGVSAQHVLDVAHFISAGVVSFARGLNDTPKIVGLLIVVQALDIRLGLTLIGVAIAVGGLLNAKKVGNTVSKKITPMNAGQGFTANLVTGLLVTTASIHGMPVSTTHVSVGSIFGIGSATKKADLKVVGSILLSWLLTLPIAALMSAGLYWLLT